MLNEISYLFLTLLLAWQPVHCLPSRLVQLKCRLDAASRAKFTEIDRSRTFIQAASLILAFCISISESRAEMFIQTPRAKGFAGLVQAALQENDTLNPEIKAQIIAAQQQIAAMGSVADKRLIQMVSEWLTLSKQGEIGTIEGMVYPDIALRFVSHDPDAASLLGPLVEWMDRLAEGNLHDEGTFPQQVAMFIALWGGESEIQRLKSDMDKLLASSTYDAHMTGLQIQRALDGQPSGPKRFAHLQSTISQWCQRQIDRRNGPQSNPLRRADPNPEENPTLRDRSITPTVQPVQQTTKLAAAKSVSQHWWLWSAAGAVVLIIIYLLVIKRVWLL